MLWQAVAQDERERLERGTGSEHVVEVAVLDAGVEEDELPEVGEDASAVGEAAGVRELPESEVEAAELGAAEDVGGEAHVDGRRRVDEEELLHALRSEESRPPGEFILAVEAPEEAEGEAYGAERTGVGGEEVVHGGNGLVHAGDDEVRVVEDERHGAPGAAPPGGERDDALGVLDGRREATMRRSAAESVPAADGEAAHSALAGQVHGGRHRQETRVLVGDGGGGELVGVMGRRRHGCCPAACRAVASGHRHWEVG
uniref:Uncharacterized protein n=1 Tax=Setaria italica TaxID=4555 RepID=K3XPT6_SETIT